MSWKPTILTTEAEALELLLELSGRGWLYRGQPERFDGLIPSIDRKPLEHLSRAEKLSLERQSINLFRSNARFFSHPGEEAALVDDVIALMVLRHYGVPTRLLDWSRSPYVAAYFAVSENDSEDGEIWAFDEPLYEKNGKQQWRDHPETTADGSGDPDRFRAELTAFKENSPDWFICPFYPTGFHRQNAQDGAYSCTSQFGRDHAEAVARLLKDDSRYHLYIIPARLKAKVRTLLRERHGVWHGSLFPDSAGAAKRRRRSFGSLKGREVGRVDCTLTPPPTPKTPAPHDSMPASPDTPAESFAPPPSPSP